MKEAPKGRNDTRRNLTAEDMAVPLFTDWEMYDFVLWAVVVLMFGAFLLL